LKFLWEFFYAAFGRRDSNGCTAFPARLLSAPLALTRSLNVRQALCRICGPANDQAALAGAEIDCIERRRESAVARIDGDPLNFHHTRQRDKLTCPAIRAAPCVTGFADQLVEANIGSIDQTGFLSGIDSAIKLARVRFARGS